MQQILLHSADKNNGAFGERKAVLMTREEIIQQVKRLIAAPSCYAALKEKAEKYLASQGSAHEKTAAHELIAELKADVQSIDAVISFFGSEKAKEIFGAETAAQLEAKAKAVKAAGGDTCFCDACTAGKMILDNQELL